MISSRRWEGGTDGSYELHITAWSFWLLTPILKLSESPLRRYLMKTKYAFNDQKISQNLGSLCQEPESKTKY